MCMCAPSPTHEVKGAHTHNERVHTRTYIHMCILTSAHTHAIVYPKKHTLTEHAHKKHTCIHSYTYRDAHMQTVRADQQWRAGT